jgi:hypothetical protein
MLRALMTCLAQTGEFRVPDMRRAFPSCPRWPALMRGARFETRRRPSTRARRDRTIRMPMIVIDPLTNASLWTPLQADGVTPSTAIGLAIDSALAPPGPDTSSALVSASTAALNNVLRRSLGPIDLTQYDELRFWIYGDVPANGTAAWPFYLELRLASAAMPLADPANTWQRFLPVSQTRQWETVRLTLAGLPAAVRGAVTTLQLRCANAGTAFNCHLDDIIAVREAMIGDVDNAFLAGLNSTLSIGGTAVPAVLQPASGTITTPAPYFQILQFDALYSRERTDSAPARVDFTNTGYSLLPPGNAYELLYQVTAVADDRATQATMLEFALRTLPSRGMMLVNGTPLPFESIYVAPINRLGGSRNDTIPLFYKVSARQASGPAILVAPAQTAAIDTDMLAQ